MGFESGAVSFRVFHLPRKLPRDFAERFAEHAAPPLESARHGPVRGWVSGRHLLERNIEEENIVTGGYLHLHLLLAERKIPRSLLLAECRMEELAHLAAQGGGGLSRAVRTEIRRRVEERLLPKMPAQLHGLPVLQDPSEFRLFAGALSTPHVDAFTVLFQQTLGVMPVPLDPVAAGMQRAQTDLRKLPAASWLPDLDAGQVSDQPGHDFLTWLWFASETRGGTAEVPGHGTFAFAVEGPLTFIMEGNGAHEIVLRKGQPLVSVEAKTALLAGKKLKSCRVVLAQEDREWRVGVEGGEFVFRSLKIPPVESLDAVGRFQERVRHVQTFADAFFALYDLFLKERVHATGWKRVAAEMGEWIRKRKTQK